MCIRDSVSAPWVDGTTVKVDANIMKWVEQTKEFTDKGYNNKSRLWDNTWAADQGPDCLLYTSASPCSRDGGIRPFCRRISENNPAQDSFLSGPFRAYQPSLR